MHIVRKNIRVNYGIRASEIRVIDQDGNMLGVMNVQDAVKKAEAAGLDLVEVAPGAVPPVCRIIDFSRYKYDQEKKEKEARKKQHVVHLKELRFGPKIGEHDYQVKLHSLQDFLKRGDKVKVTMVFRGREMTHIDLGRKILDRIGSDISGVGEVEQSPGLEGRFMHMVVRPK